MNKILAAATFAALAGGCASSSFQPCVLADACSSRTTRASTMLPPPARGIASVCVDRLATPTLGEGHRAPVPDNATMRFVRLYVDQSSADIIRALRAQGVEATACSPATQRDVPRLLASVGNIVSDTTAIGAYTQLDISVRLTSPSLPPSAPVWTADFRTGNRNAGTQPDLDHVRAYADNVVAELEKSGWVTRR